MAVEIVDTLKAVRDDDRRTDIMMTRRLHSWLLCFPEPGEKDKLHCHNEDETFYCVQGECTMHFPDGGETVMTPGMIALIPGGEFYQLENTGKGPLVLLGNRSGSRDETKHIDYETRQVKRQQKKAVAK